MMNKTKPKVIKDAAYFSAIGKLGGNTTKARKLAENPNYYCDIGSQGGNKLLETRGVEYYRQISAISKKGTKK